MDTGHEPIENLIARLCKCNDDELPNDGIVLNQCIDVNDDGH